MGKSRSRKKGSKVKPKIKLTAPKQETDSTETLYVRGVSPETIKIFNEEAKRLGFKRFGHNRGKFFDHLAQAIKNGKKSA